MNKRSKNVILAVDDAPVNLDIVKAILSAEYTVKAAVDGQMALKIVENDIPDLILLDITMPEMDGYEVCRRLQENVATKDIPIIFLTAKDQDDDEAAGLKMGAVDYITKPINPAILAARVRTHLNLYQARKTLAEQNSDLIEAARMRDDVEHILRHDLKSPLNAITGFPQLLLLDDNLTEKQRTLLADIEGAGWHMLSMIDRSLNILKMEYGTYEPRCEDVDVLAVVKKVLAEQRGFIDRKSLHVNLVVDGRPACAGDVMRMTSEELLLHSVLSNLLKNAVEAAPMGDTITVSMAVDENALSLEIENGGEVPTAIRDRFFDKYITAGKSNGTGLGTYSAKLITETLGGTIRLDATTPQRTRICMVFPNKRAPS